MHIACHYFCHFGTESTWGKIRRLPKFIPSRSTCPIKSNIYNTCYLQLHVFYTIQSSVHDCSIFFACSIIRALSTHFFCKKLFLLLFFYHFIHGPVGCGCWIHRLHLCCGVRPPPNECPRYDIKQSDGEALVMLEFWGMQSTPSLPVLPGSLWAGVVPPDRVLCMGQIELFDIQTECKHGTNAKLNCEK